MSRPPATLAEHLARRIEAEGPLTLAAWMAECLGNERWGYYRTRDPLGARGDFTTAPEISQVFGELLGLWAADCWARMGAPSAVRVVELGPGRGTLMQDFLRAARVLPAFRAAIDLHLVETSPVLRARQAEALAGAGATWHDSLDTVPDGPVIAIANEFFDALPIHQIERTPAGWAERRVDLAENGGFRLALDPRPTALAATLPPALAALPPGAVVELCPAAAAIARDLGQRLARWGGAALAIDYGHARPGAGETLQAMRRHAFAPVLEAPGEADLTAHVDFGALAAAARAGGAESWGPVPQGDLLRVLGAAERGRRLAASAAPAQAEAIRTALARLIDADQMGTLFKALALTAPGFGPPAGFAVTPTPGPAAVPAPTPPKPMEQP
ncbi:class I SAM-dependent methyltransferase [Arenibaculum pallidiluteum]|uniref:class I SAM-dependent methyltransferase n=1 Tax=Arenibaculum pallidiluteum TaxID=2812559 RepID=UPI001A9630A2|nr:SAM-dependent methyltransferase [Arenibaculum pallidiluteum]